MDPGFLTYHEWDTRRQYLRSPRAHSLVMVGEGDYRTGESEVVEWKRTAEGDWVTGYHVLPGARHTRRVLFIPPQQVVITDEIAPTGREIAWRQLFQVAPDLAVHVIDNQTVELIAPEGTKCIISQNRPGKWHVIAGQTQPRLQGWYSERYGDWQPGKTVVFEPGRGVGKVTTEISMLRR